MGGEDFTNNLIKHVREKIGDQITEWTELLEFILRKQCESAKIALATQPEYQIVVGHATCEVTVDEFNEINHDLFQSTIETMEKTLDALGATKEEVDDVVLVGGSTRIPKIKEMVANCFGNRLELRTPNPDEIVAIGMCEESTHRMYTYIHN